MHFLKSKMARILTILLLLEAASFYGIAARSERIPQVRPLDDFPRQIDGWQTTRESRIEKEVQDVLKADDTLNRWYANTSVGEANLFVAFFKTQRTGQAPHSPKNCLPGAGWEPSETGFLTLRVDGEAEPITINHYVVAHGNDKSVVLYWYQSAHRVVASEYSAKLWLVLDSIRYHRSDTALVRIVVPVGNDGETAATNTALRFVQAVFPKLTHQLPS